MICRYCGKSISQLDPPQEGLWGDEKWIVCNPNEPFNVNTGYQYHAPVLITIEEAIAGLQRIEADLR